MYVNKTLRLVQTNRSNDSFIHHPYLSGLCGFEWWRQKKLLLLKTMGFRVLVAYVRAVADSNSDRTIKFCLSEMLQRRPTTFIWGSVGLKESNETNLLNYITTVSLIFRFIINHRQKFKMGWFGVMWERRGNAKVQADLATWWPPGVGLTSLSTM